MYEPHPPMYCGANDGGVKRGDRADTGDLEARPTRTVNRGGSGASPQESGGAVPTADPSGLAESRSEGLLENNEVLVRSDRNEEYEILSADDPKLGLTATKDTPAEDWAADTGPPRNPEGIEEEIEWPPGEAEPRETRRPTGRKTPSKATGKPSKPKTKKAR